MPLSYKSVVPFFVVQPCNTFGGELEMSHEVPDKIHLWPREDIHEEGLSNLFPELVTKGLLQPCLQ